MAENKEKLFDKFPPVSTEEWRAKVETDLKGADFQNWFGGQMKALMYSLCTAPKISRT